MKKIVFPCFFKDGVNIVTHKIDIANKFHNYFINVGTNLSNKNQRINHSQTT